MDWRRTSITIQTDHYEKLRDMAFDQRVSISYLIKKALELYFEKLGVRFNKKRESNIKRKE